MEGLPKFLSETQCAPNCKCLKHDQPPVEDRRLLLWNRNQRQSDRIRDYLCERIKRPKHELLMNSLGSHRRMQEQRTLAAYAQVPCNFDKYRGNPTFWKLPPKLHRKCGERQEYYVHLSRLDRFIVPQLEYIHIPKIFRSTSTSMGKPLTSQRNFQSLQDYALKRLDSICIKKIQPHIPDLEDVFLVGKTQQPVFAEKDRESSYSEVILQRSLLNQQPSQTETQTSKPIDQHSFAYLIINDQKIMSDSEGTIQTSVNFDTACGEDTQMSYLFVQNSSTWTLRISFEETKKTPTFAVGPNTKDSGSNFYFDRNYRVIMPAEKVDVPIWFRSPKCGFFDQLLKMSVVPDLWHGKVIINIALNASSLEADSSGKCREYEQMIQDRVRNRMIADCLNQMLKAIPPKESQITIYTYGKGIIFEALNSVFDPLHSRPKYIYDKEVVDELEAFYESVRLEQHPEFWTLNLNDLRIVTKDREAFERAKTLTENYEHVFAAIELNKEMRSEMRLRLDKMFLGDGDKKKGKGKDADKSKSGGKKSPKDKNAKKEKDGTKKSGKTSPKKGKYKETPKIKEPDRTDIPKTLTDHLEEIISKLRSPVMMQDVRCQRFKIAYNLFCSYMDKITTEVREMCQNHFSLERPDPLEVLRNTFSTSHMRCEQLLNCDMDSKAFFNYPKNRGTPQPPWALEIPMDDYQGRYDAMHPPTTKGKGKKKSKTKLTSKSSKETGSKKKEGTSIKSKNTKKTTKSAKQDSIITEAVINLEAIEEEEPFIEDIPYEQDEDWFYLIPSDKVDHYRNNMYTVFYNNLCSFANDLELGFCLISGEGPSPAEIQRIKFNQQKDLLLDQGLQVECVNLKDKISQMLRLGDVDGVGLDDQFDQFGNLKSNIFPKIQPPKEDLLQKSSSVWNVIKTYVPKKLKKVPVIDHDDELLGEEEAVTPEEIITERKIQTSFCSDISVCLSDALLPHDPSRKICICGRTINHMDDEKRVSSFHNSECFMSSVSTPSSPDISSLDSY